MMEEDAGLAVFVTFVAERILDLGNLVRCCTREIVRSHCNGNWAVEIDSMIAECHVTLPTGNGDRISTGNTHFGSHERLCD